MGDQIVIDSFDVDDKVEVITGAKQDNISEFDEPVRENYSPPPIIEISVPSAHEYGYGYYLKPLWNLDHKKYVYSTDKIKRVRQLLDEGKMRQKRKDLAKLIIKAR